jgi:hypothetical protein
MLINEEHNNTDHHQLHMDKSAENLFAELHAGGMKKDEMESVREFCQFLSSFNAIFAI